ncbi:MAG: hypothetical protein IKA10_02230 [Oscillospiraceae bacterium]|nr:hypothetical protein [Oscillospiraceae bacterium]
MAKFSFISYKLFPSVFNMSVTASVVILILFVFRSFFKSIKAFDRKIPSTIFYALWIVVLFRLLCPFSITSDKSFFQQYDSPINRTSENVSVIEYVPADIVHTEYPAVDLPVGFVNHIINHYMPQGEEQLRADPLEAPVAIATNVWFTGIFCMAMYGFHSYINLKKKLIGAIRLKENIYICDYISSPFVIGTVKPKIYLPSTLNENEAEYVIAHEKHHIKRFDHIFKLTAFIALTLHWFNPFVWIAFEFAMQDMEMSCDEAVIKKLGDDVRSKYSQSLLNFATGKHIFAGAPLAFGEGDTQVRIKNLYADKKNSILYTSLAVVFAVFLSFRLMANPDTYKGEILYNGMIYHQSGLPLVTIPGERSRNIGVLNEIADADTDLTKELSGKYIDSKNLNLPIYQSSENAETIFLTTGDGWIPFTSDSMQYATTQSWIKPVYSEGWDNTYGWGIGYTINLADDVVWEGIYEDIYQYGELVSSSIVAYSTDEDEGPNKTYGIENIITVTEHNEMRISITNHIDDLTVEFMDNPYVKSRRKIPLPDEEYSSMMIRPAFNKNIKTFKLLSNDSFDLIAVSLGTGENGAIYTDHTNPNQACVIVYRFVTSTIPLR